MSYEPELFDQKADPEEESNLAGDPKHAAVLAEMQGELTARIDPNAINAEAQAAQAALVIAAGGRDAVLSKGNFQGTPAPGEKPEYVL